MNVFEWAEDRARREGTEVEQVLREKLGKRYESRVEFERIAGAVDTSTTLP